MFKLRTKTNVDGRARALRVSTAGEIDRIVYLAFPAESLKKRLQTKQIQDENLVSNDLVAGCVRLTYR